MGGYSSDAVVLVCRVVRSPVICSTSSVDRPDQRTDVAERPFAVEIVPKPTQLDELGLDRCTPNHTRAVAAHPGPRKRVFGLISE